MHGKKWTHGNLGLTSYYGPENEKKNIPIDDIIAFQGSCWFCHKNRFLDLDGFYLGKHSHTFYQEALELSFKFWLSGGKAVVNKNTWFAHWHKQEPPGFGLKRSDKIKAENYCTWYWLNDKWPKRTRDIKWLIDKFMPMPGWPENWEEVKVEFEKQHPELFSSTETDDE
jgi:hypothetical protein